MEGPNAYLEADERMQHQQLYESEVISLSRQLEAIEDRIQYLEVTLMAHLADMQGIVEELARRMDEFGERWSEQTIANVSIFPSDATPPPPLPRRRNKGQGTLTKRRVERRYKRLVKSHWDDKSAMTRFKMLDKKRRQSI